MEYFGLQQVGLELGTGAVIGGLIGFTAKKVAKIVAFLIGLELALFKFLESQGILTVDWGRLSAGLVDATDAATGSEPPGIVVSFLSVVPVSAGFSGGFFLGFRKG